MPVIFKKYLIGLLIFDLILLAMGYMGIASGMRANYMKHKYEMELKNRAQEKMKDIVTTNIDGKHEVSSIEKKVEKEAIKIVTPGIEAKPSAVSPLGA